MNMELKEEKNTFVLFSGLNYDMQFAAVADIYLYIIAEYYFLDIYS